MMRGLVIVTMWCGALGACNSRDGDGSIQLPDAPGGGGDTIQYQPFTGNTHSLGDGNSDHFVLSITNAEGQVACGLSNDFHASLGTAGHQIFADVGYIAGYPCPTGSHTITNQNCPTNLTNEFTLKEGCAYYRRFDSTGAVIGITTATAGNITVSGNDANCSFSVSLSFSGQQFSEVFALQNGLTAQPWCD